MLYLLSRSLNRSFRMDGIAFREGARLANDIGIPSYISDMNQSLLIKLYYNECTVKLVPKNIDIERKGDNPIVRQTTQ